MIANADGMADWIEKHGSDRRLQLQRDLIATYRDDFNKYRNRVPADLLRRTMDAVPQQLGGRFIYGHVDMDVRHGEIDYVIQQGSLIVPIEVKAGAAGSMKSLHAFMRGKELSLAVRFDTNLPSVQDLDVRTTTGERVKYRLLSLPLYMVESLPAVIQRM